MAYIQTKQANVNISGTEGLCLVYAREVFGVASKYQTASQAWEGAQFKHTDQDFPNVAVPVWFTDHVEVWKPGVGFYGSPYNTPTGHILCTTIAQVEQHYGVKFLGWSEDIDGVRVAQSVTAPAAAPVIAPAPGPVSGPTQTFSAAPPAPAATPANRYVNFPANVTSWWTYAPDGPYDDEHHAHVLDPGKFGGYSKQVVREVAQNVFVIQTADYGEQAVIISGEVTVTESPQLQMA